MDYTKFQHLKVPQGVKISEDWQDFVRRDHIITDDKTSVPLWSPALFEGGKRSNQNVTELTALVYDVDDVSDEVTRSVREELLGADLNYWIYSTHSHKSLGKDNALRIVLPLSEHADLDLWRRVWLHVADKFHIPFDRACTDPARVYFYPSAPTPKHIISDYRLSSSRVRPPDYSVSDEEYSRLLAKRSIGGKVAVEPKEAPESLPKPLAPMCDDLQLVPKPGGWEVGSVCPICLSVPESAVGAEPGKGFIHVDTLSYSCRRGKCPANKPLLFSRWSRVVVRRELELRQIQGRLKIELERLLV